MKMTIIITLITLAALSALGGVAHENPGRGRNAAIVAAAAIASLAAIEILGGA